MERTHMIIKEIRSDDEEECERLSFEGRMNNILSHWIMTDETASKNEGIKKIENNDDAGNAKGIIENNDDAGKAKRTIENNDGAGKAKGTIENNDVAGEAKGTVENNDDAGEAKETIENNDDDEKSKRKLKRIRKNKALVLFKDVEAIEKGVQAIKIDEPSTILKLPDELLINIFKYCTSSSKDFIRIGGACKRFRRLCEDWSLYELFKIDLGMDVVDVYNLVRKYKHCIKRVDIETDDLILDVTLTQLLLCKKLQVLNIVSPRTTKKNITQIYHLLQANRELRSVSYINSRNKMATINRKPGQPVSNLMRVYAPYMTLTESSVERLGSLG